MLVYIFKEIEKSKVYKAIRWFFSSIFYIALIGTITLISNIYGMEILTLKLFTLFGLIIPFVFLDDLTPIIPPLFFGYITISRINNDYNTNTSIFNNLEFINTLYLYFTIIFSLLLIRIILDFIIKKDRKRNLRFIISLVLMSVSFVLGGALTEYYKSNTIYYSLVLGGLFIIPYLVLMLTIDFTKLRVDYFAYLLLVFGIVLTIELAHIYLSQGLENIFNGEVNKSFIYTGWGIDNNIGGALTLSTVSSAYLSIKKRFGFLYLPFLFINLISVVFTLSRAAILTIILLFIISIVLIIIYSKRKRRLINIITLLILVSLSILSYFIFKKYIDKVVEPILNTLLKEDLDAISSGRLTIYKYGIDQFLNNKLFGVGFFSLEIHSAPYLQTGFVPARYHNTIVQILSSSGLFGIITYLIHRVSTITPLFKKPKEEEIFIFLSILGLILSSLLDCHLFNLGPTMEYSILLALYNGIIINRSNN